MKYQFARVERTSDGGFYFADVTELSEAVQETRTADVYIAGVKVHSIGDPVFDEIGRPVMTVPEPIAFYNDAIIDHGADNPMSAAFRAWLLENPHNVMPLRLEMQECYVLEPDMAWHCVVRDMRNEVPEDVIYILRLDDQYKDEAVIRSFLDWRDVRKLEITEWVEPPLALENYPSLQRPQFLKGMRRLGVKKADVEAVIAKLPDDGTREDVMIDFEETQVFQRNSDLVIAISSDPSINISEEDLNAAWLVAAEL